MFLCYTKIWSIILFSGCVLLPPAAVFAQYVSPNKYGDGGFRPKTSSEISSEENRNNHNSYYNRSNTSGNTDNSRKNKSTEPKQPTYERKKIEPKKTPKQLQEEAAETANRKKEEDRQYEYIYHTSEFSQIYRTIRDYFQRADYLAIDKITLANNYLTDSEKKYRHDGMYRDRIRSRILSNYYLGRLDTCWAYSKLLLHDVNEENNGQFWQALVLLQSGKTDSALKKANSKINGESITFRYANFMGPFHCIKARAILEKGDAAEALKVINEFTVNYHGKCCLEYVHETKGMVFQKLGYKDSALYYYLKAIKRDSAVNEVGYGRNIQMPIEYSTPTRVAFLEAARLGGYDLNKPDDAGHLYLEIADKMGMKEARHLLAKKSGKPPVTKKPVKANAGK